MIVTVHYVTTWVNDYLRKVKLFNAMKQRIKEIILEEDRPFSFVDFRRFELNCEAYEMKHGTFRNNIVALKKAGEVD
jgi:hypothetical protein